MRRCASIYVNGWYSNPRQAHQIARLTEEGARRGIVFDVIKNNVPVAIGDVFKTEFAIFLDKDLILAENIALSGVPVFNAPQAIRLSDDKALSACKFFEKGIPALKTVAAPKRYGEAEDEAYLSRVFASFDGRPIIVKERESSLGTGVYRVETLGALIDTVKTLGAIPHLFQEEARGMFGTSVRIFVAKKKAVGAIRLCNKNDFRSNAELGGVAEPYEPSEKETGLAIAAADALGLTFGGIDLFPGDAPQVIEANSNAYFESFERVTKKNAAAAIVEAILDELNRNLRVLTPSSVVDRGKKA